MSKKKRSKSTAHELDRAHRSDMVRGLMKVARTASDAAADIMRRENAAVEMIKKQVFPVQVLAQATAAADILRTAVVDLKRLDAMVDIRRIFGVLEPSPVDKIRASVSTAADVAATLNRQASVSTQFGELTATLRPFHELGPLLDEIVAQMPEAGEEFEEPSPEEDADERPDIEIIPGGAGLVELLRDDIEQIRRLSDEQFEDFLCERLAAAGLSVEKSGSTYARDGGVDILACSPSGLIPNIVGVQAKHHRSSKRKTGSADVRAFGTTLQAERLFTAGMIVTSTAFTKGAALWARKVPKLVLLRDLEDIRRWLTGDMSSGADWREVPEVIRLPPDIILKVPRRK